MLKIGIVGCGAIGSLLARAIEKDIKKAELKALSDIDPKRPEALKKSLKSAASISTLDELIDSSDLVIECAQKDFVAEVATKSLERKKDIMIMSVSGLVENTHLFGLAEKNNCNIYIPSGAIAGIDALKAAKENRIDSVTLTTTKPRKGLEGAPYIEKNNIDLSKIKKKTKIFEGNVKDAITGFPKNVNVSATLALAGIGAQNTKVNIILDPGTGTNSHEIKITGSFGEITTTTKNTPCPDNPKTSHLAALSAIAKIREITSNTKIGT